MVQIKKQGQFMQVVGMNIFKTKIQTVPPIPANRRINFEHMWGRVYCVKCNHYTMEITSGHHQPEDIQEQYQQWLDYHKQGMCKMTSLDQLELPLIYKEQPKPFIKKCMAKVVSSGKKWSRVVMMFSAWLLLLIVIAYILNGITGGALFVNGS